MELNFLSYMEHKRGCFYSYNESKGSIKLEHTFMFKQHVIVNLASYDPFNVI